MSRQSVQEPRLPEARARALEGLRVFAQIEEQLRAGAEITKPDSVSFLEMFRARVERYRGDVVVSVGSLRWLRDILKRQLRRKSESTGV